MTNWQKLCELLTNSEVFGKLKRRYGGSEEQEKRFEDHFSEYLFTVFGWMPSEIKRQYALSVGSGTKIIPDITLIKKNERPVIFELKSHTVSPNVAGYDEIKSQIKQASVSYGFFTNGITLHLLYRSSNNEEPYEIFRVSFLDKDNEYATELCDIITRDNYTEERMLRFCDKLSKIIATEYENNPKLFMISSQMNHKLDTKIQKMIGEYIRWIDNNPKEHDAAFSFREERKWIRKNIFDVEKLRSLSDEEYSQLMHEIPKHTLAINGYGMMMLYGEKRGEAIPDMGIIGDRSKFIRCIEYLNSIPRKEAQDALKKFTNKDSEYKILGVGPMFWSEMIRCKFDNIPLQNQKTDKFFRAVGIELGFTAEQKTQSIVYCHDRWLAEWNKDESHLQLDSSALSHMEHFALTSDEGKEFLKQEFVYTEEDD